MDRDPEKGRPESHVCASSYHLKDESFLNNTAMTYPNKYTVYYSTAVRCNESMRENKDIS